MFIASQSVKESVNFVEQLREAREERETERLKDDASVVIQAAIRGWLARIRLKKLIR